MTAHVCTQFGVVFECPVTHVALERDKRIGALFRGVFVDGFRLGLLLHLRGTSGIKCYSIFRKPENPFFLN